MLDVGGGSGGVIAALVSSEVVSGSSALVFLGRSFAVSELSSSGGADSDTTEDSDGVVTEAMAAKSIATLPDFSTEALHATGVSFCTREHFGSPQLGEDRSYIRLAYSGIDEADITDGLVRLREWITAG